MDVFTFFSICCNFMYLLHGVLDIYLRDPFLKYWNNGMIEGILIGLKQLYHFKI